MKILRSWTFKWWEVALLKVCLLSLGIMIGLFLYKSAVHLVWLWWALFVATTIYFVTKFLMSVSREDTTKEQVKTNKENVNKGHGPRELLSTINEHLTKATEAVVKEPTPPTKQPVQVIKEPIPQAKEQVHQNKEPASTMKEPLHANRGFSTMIEETAPLSKEPVSATPGPINKGPMQVQREQPANREQMPTNRPIPPVQGTMPMK